MSVRVVLYAEGSGETQGEGYGGLPPAPGDPLSDSHLGPGHILVRRSLAETWRMPEAAIRFEAPLRGARGTTVRGSGLLRRETLRQLLTWPRADRRPDLVVVLIDADGHPDRKALLESHIADLPITRVIGVAVQEFEAWLIADTDAVAGALAPPARPPRAVEQLSPRQAKELLRSWTGTQTDRHHRARSDLARLCDLGAVGKRCPSFQEFMKDLARARP